MEVLLGNCLPWWVEPGALDVRVAVCLFAQKAFSGANSEGAAVNTMV